jgi:hypothetical protein
VITYVMVTRNRAERLGRTLRAIGELAGHEAEVVVVDHGSAEQHLLPSRLANGIGVRSVPVGYAGPGAARTAGVRASDPASAWIVMLDDDSVPVDCAFSTLLGPRVDSSVGAVAAEVWVGPRTRPVRECGGLPEVFVGCGAAVRREVYLGLGGYDATMGAPGDEADFCARLLMAGLRVAFEPGLRVVHARDESTPSPGTLLGRRVRNAGWLIQRYAPEATRLAARREARSRLRGVAEKGWGRAGIAAYRRGLLELRRSGASQHRSPMSAALWDRFTGLTAARQAVATAQREARFTTAMIVDAGVHAWAVALALEEHGVRLTQPGEDAQVQVIGTLDPGSMLDAYERRAAMRGPAARRVVLPWVGALCGTLAMERGLETLSESVELVRRPSRAA